MSFAAVLLVLVFVVLYVKNRTPRQALYSVAREVLKGLRRLRLPFPALEKILENHNPKPAHYSPYKKTRKDVAHCPLILNLPTSEGSGEAAHPDVLRLPEAWGAGGWTWLMSATPYPFGNDFFEHDYQVES